MVFVVVVVVVVVFSFFCLQVFSGLILPLHKGAKVITYLGSLVQS